MRQSHDKSNFNIKSFQKVESRNFIANIESCLVIKDKCNGAHWMIHQFIL